MKITVFRDIAPYSLVEVLRSFRVTCCLLYQGDDCTDQYVEAVGFDELVPE